MHNPDFVKLAEAMGVKGIYCDNLNDLPAKMDEFMRHDGPVLFDARVVKTEHVLCVTLSALLADVCRPMVAAGKALHEMAVSPAQAAKSKSAYTPYN